MNNDQFYKLKSRQKAQALIVTRRHSLNFLFENSLRLLLIFAFSLILTFIFSKPAHAADSPKPKLSFTLKGYYKGELEKFCEPRLTKAKEQGFRAVAISPSWAYDTTLNKTLLDKTVSSSEVTACLQKAWDLGFMVIYQPHLDALQTLNDGASENSGTQTAPDQKNSWRANFDFKPDQIYFETVLIPFWNWIEKNKTVMKKNSKSPVVFLNISAELETSTTKHPQEWLQLFEKNQDFRKKSGLSPLRLQIGFNINWGPRFEPNNCVEYQKLISKSEFLAVSLYGDLSPLIDDPNYVDVRLKEFKSELSQKKKPEVPLKLSGLTVSEKSRTPTTQSVRCELKLPTDRHIFIGEIGVGGDFTQSHTNTRLPASVDDYKSKRFRLYKNMVEWLVTRPNMPYINFWTVGVFDVFGLRESESTVVDENVIELFRQYSQK